MESKEDECNSVTSYHTGGEHDSSGGCNDDIDANRIGDDYL